ncbi:MAG: response regulator [Eubacteriales bacterium]|nr:response regulator [Eubacteriales bacterium]
MKKRVLIVEDDKFFRFAVRKMIDWDKYGFQIVGEAVHGEAALSFLEECQAEVVITDMSMPVMNGIELTKALKEQYPDIMIIALSAYDDFEFVKESLKLGAQDYILKQDLDKEDVGKMIWNSWEKHRKTLARDNDIKRGVRKILLESGKDDRGEWYLRLCLEEQWGFYFLRFQSLESGWHSEDCMQENWMSDSLFELHDHKEHFLFMPALKAHSLKVQSEDRDKRIRELELLLESEQYVAGCSSRGDNADRLWELSREAQNAMEAGRFSRRKQIQVWDYVRDKYESRDIYFLEEESSFSQMIKKVTPEKGLELLTAKLYEKMPGEESINKNYMGYLKAAAQNLGIGSLEFSGLKEHLDKAGTLEKKHEICKEYLDRMFVRAGQREMHPGVRAAISYMKQNYVQDLSLSGIASVVGLNESYFSGIFKKDTGKSITEYLNEIRIKKARDLIAATNLKNYEIAEKVGINNSSYFSTIFKKYTGMTIQEYRQRMVSYEEPE